MAGCCLNHFQFGNPIWIPVNGPDVLNQEFGRIYLKRRSVSLIAFSQSTTYPIQCFEFVKARKRLRCTISGCGFNHQGLNLLLIRTAAAVSVQEVRDGSEVDRPFFHHGGAPLVVARFLGNILDEKRNWLHLQPCGLAHNRQLLTRAPDIEKLTSSSGCSSVRSG